MEQNVPNAIIKQVQSKEKHVSHKRITFETETLLFEHLDRLARTAIEIAGIPTCTKH